MPPTRRWPWAGDGTWAFDGGTASYAAPAVVDPPDAGPYYPVQPVETGNDGATASILERSDVAIADHECPIIAQRGRGRRT